jgi:hypothetical protein
MSKIFFKSVSSYTPPHDWDKALPKVSEFKIREIPLQLIRHGLSIEAEEIVIFEGFGRSKGTVALFYKDGDVSQKLELPSEGYHHAITAHFQLLFDFSRQETMQFCQATFEEQKISVGLARVSREGSTLKVSANRTNTSGLIVIKLN